MDIRRLYSAVEESFSDMGQQANEPLRKVAVVAVVKNPHAGQGYIEDLSDLIDESKAIGDKIAGMAAAHLKPFAADS